MSQWPGFSFSVERICELIDAGMRLVLAQGVVDYRGFCRVNLFWRQACRYSYVQISDWKNAHAGSCGHLFFWGMYQPSRPYSRFPYWSWQVPGDPSAVQPENFTGSAWLAVPDWQIIYVIRSLGQSRIISRAAFDRGVDISAP